MLSWTRSAVTRGLRPRWHSPHVPLARRCNSSVSSSHQDEALRILFCGSDKFSVTCLNALLDYQKSSESNVASIDVATKTDKRTGRGMQVSKPTPIKTTALSHNLGLHQFDTFTGWKPPQHINMVVAVSYGRLVPPRILDACKFGGLNVHPSLLPDLKGSAPIQHAILYGYRTTGVSVQTLHPSKLDQGKVLFQTFFDIPQHSTIRYPELHDHLAGIGAKALVQAIRERRYLDTDALPVQKYHGQLRVAHKYTTASQHINFRRMTSVEILRMDRAFGKVWFDVVGDTQHGDTTQLRFVLKSGIFGATLDDTPDWMLEQVDDGVPFIMLKTATKAAAPVVYVRCADGKYLRLGAMVLSGYNPGDAADLAQKAGLLDSDNVIEHEGIRIQPFRKAAVESDFDFGLVDLPWIAAGAVRTVLSHG